MKIIFGTLVAIFIGSCSLAIPMDAGFYRIPREMTYRSVLFPVLPQVCLPLVSAGTGGAVATPCGSPVYTLVQQNDALSGSCTSCTATITSAPTNGNMVILITSGAHVTQIPAISSVSSTNTTWTKDAASNRTSGSTNTDTELWHGLVSGGAGGTTVTIVWSQSILASGFTYSVSEWSGNVTSSPSDGTTGTITGNSTTPSTTSYSTAVSTCELVIVALGCASNCAPSSFPGVPYTTLAHPAGASFGSYNVSSPLGAQSSASWGIGVQNWVTFIQGYKHL